MPILHLAGKASIRRRPVNSALGCVSKKLGVYSASLHQQPSRASAGRSVPRGPRSTMQRLQEPSSTKAALRGCRSVHTESKPQGQFHGRAAYERTGSLVQGRAGGAGRQSPRSANFQAVAGSYRPASVRFNCSLPFAHWSTQPNLSFNRTANGVSPWPRGSVVHHLPRGQGATPSSAG